MRQPSSFSVDLADEWAVWVLNHRLPDLPNDLATAESIPVAFWAGPRFGAVRRISRFDDDDRSGLDDDVDLFERTGTGWESLGASGCGSWSSTPAFRPHVVADRVASIEGSVGCVAGEVACIALELVVGSAAAVIQLNDSDGVSRREIHAPMGVAVVCTDATRPAIMRILDRDGATLLEEIVANRK